jgi:hypothetical protein
MLGWNIENISKDSLIRILVVLDNESYLAS